MLVSPFAVRILFGTLLVICGTIVLGISAHVENIVSYSACPVG